MKYERVLKYGELVHLWLTPVNKIPSKHLQNVRNLIILRQGHRCAAAAESIQIKEADFDGL